MKVTIDENSGFCFGVKRAIEQAEKLLEERGKLFCLGDIVHNNAEMERLREHGLACVSREEIDKLKNQKILFRAHGEPPSSYKITEKNNNSLTDATCPIVSKLQERIKKAWAVLSKSEGQLVIFGNPDHPETIGLQGQTDGKAIVVTSPGNLSEIDPKRPVELFSQTTKNNEEFLELKNNIRKLMKDHFKDGELPLRVHNTICKQISGRIPLIRKFAASQEVIVFVGGRQSSNAKILFGHCKEVNPKSWFVSVPEEVTAKWFNDARSAGVCGATSTPQWLMKDVAEKIRELTRKL